MRDNPLIRAPCRGCQREANIPTHVTIAGSRAEQSKRRKQIGTAYSAATQPDLIAGCMNVFVISPIQASACALTTLLSIYLLSLSRVMLAVVNISGLILAEKFVEKTMSSAVILYV